MKHLGLFETKNRLSEICEQVATSGEPLTVTKRGKPWVKIVPVGNGDPTASVWDTVEESQSRYGSLPDDFELPARNASRRPDPLG